MDDFQAPDGVELIADGVKQNVPPAIIQKTLRLFSERILVFFQRKEIPPDTVRSLFRIQLLVFLIDQYYETNWKFQTTEVQRYWNEISKTMQSLGLNETEITSLLSDIREYEKIEQEMRIGKTVDTVPIGDFYFYKSCDVRLQRRLAEFVQNHCVAPSTQDQLDFDVLGEILDDFDDLAEDTDIYNGNRLLLGLQKNKPDTIAEYAHFLRGFLIETKPKEIQEMATSLLEKIESLE